MKVRLLHRDRDADLERPLPAWSDELRQDLELETLLEAMAAGSGFLRTISEQLLLHGLESPEEIRYREEVLGDSLANPELVRRLYDLAVEGFEAKQNARFFWFSESPDSQLRKALAMLELLVGVLERLRTVADEQMGAVNSEGLRGFFAMLRRELDDDYLALVREHLTALRFKDGVVVAAELGRGNRGAGYVLRRGERGILDRLAPDWASSMSFSVSARDEHRMRALDELRGRGIALVAAALAQATDHVLDFFAVLQSELGFYVACLNLRDRLADRGYSVCLPEPLPAAESALSARGIYDVALALQRGSGRPGSGSGVVGSDLDADGRSLIMISGANEGGKSTFLRSLGVAQLMLQAGMFVAAEQMRASVCSGLHTHFKREEDATMRSGKLDEELQRMSAIADRIEPRGLLLCNESFASTNEAEGSEVARQVIRALTERDVSVVYVTHLYDLASSLDAERLETALFLRAERLPDGTRTFRIVPGSPEPSSHGVDSFRRIFGRMPRADPGLGERYERPH